MCDSEQLGAIFVGLERTSYLLSRCKLYEMLHLEGRPNDDATLNLASALINLYEEILRFLAMAVKLYTKRTAPRAFHAVFHPDKVADSVKRFQTLEERVDTEAAVCDSANLRNMRGDLDGRDKRLMELLDGMQQPLVRVDSRISHIYSMLSEDKGAKALLWASSVPFSENHYTACKGRTDDTGQWLLGHKLYKEWRASSASMILWMHGSRKFCLCFSTFAKMAD